MPETGRLPSAQEEKLKADTMPLLTEARCQLLEKHPFVGALAMRLRLIPVFDCRMTTAVTDGTSVYVDAEFFQAISPAERLAILAHEVWHNAMRHQLRKGDRDLKRFNYACDLETDLLLQKDGFTVDLLPYDESWVGHDAEWIYERIPTFLARFETKDLHVYPTPALPGTLPPPQDPRQEEHDAETENARASQGKYLQPHLPDIRHDKVYDPDMDIHFDDDMEENWSQALENTAKACRQRGTMPACFDELVQPAERKIQDWRRLLRDYVTMLSGGSYQWIPPDRRHVHQKLYLPSRTRKPFLDLVVAMDTSGSTIEDLPDFLAELDGIAASFGEYQITLIQCDAKIQKVEVFDNEHPLPKGNFHFRGMGGTSLCPPFQYALDDMPQLPAALLYITDSDGPAPQQEPPFPVLWCLTHDGSKPTTWGLEIKL